MRSQCGGVSGARGLRQSEPIHRLSLCGITDDIGNGRAVVLADPFSRASRPRIASDSGVCGRDEGCG